MTAGARRVMVAVPALGFVPTHSLNAFLQLQLPPGSGWRVFGGGTGIAALRNQLIRLFLEESHRHFDDLLFLDADMVPAPDTVCRLLAHRRPVISALYVRRVGTPRLCCGSAAGPLQVVPRTPFGVAWTGLGCCLIQRQVLARIPFPWCVDNDWGAGEDVDFGRRVAAAGFEIVVDPTIVVGHVGEPTPLGLEHALQAGVAQWAPDVMD